VIDYIHIVDLAEGHLNNINSFAQVMPINLGTGTGYSVRDMVNAFEKASGKKVPYVIAPRRAGDIAKCYADPTYAKQVLEWRSKAKHRKNV